MGFFFDRALFFRYYRISARPILNATVQKTEAIRVNLTKQYVRVINFFRHGYLSRWQLKSSVSSLSTHTGHTEPRIFCDLKATDCFTVPASSIRNYLCFNHFYLCFYAYRDTPIYTHPPYLLSCPLFQWRLENCFH